MKTIVFIALIAYALAGTHKDIGESYRTCEKACIDEYSGHMLSDTTKVAAWESDRFGFEEYQNCRFGKYSAGHLNITLRSDWTDKYLSDWTKLQYNREFQVGAQVSDTAKAQEYQTYVHTQEELAKKEGHFIEQYHRCRFLDTLPGEEYSDMMSRIDGCHSTCSGRDGNFDQFTNSFIIDGNDRFEAGIYGKCKSKCTVKYNFDVSQRDTRVPDYDLGQCNSKCRYEWNDKATETKEIYRNYWGERVSNCTLNIDYDKDEERWDQDIERRGLRPIAQCYRYREAFYDLQNSNQEAYQLEAFDNQYWSDHLTCENFCTEFEQVEKYNKGNATDYIESKACYDGCRDTWLTSRGFVNENVKSSFAGASIKVFTMALCFIALFALL